MEVNLVLVIDGDEERGYVDDLAVDGDVSALDEDSGLVDGVGELGSEDTGLESSLEELVEGHGQDVIESVLGLSVQKTELEHLPEEGGTLEESALVLGVKSEEFSCPLSEAGQHELDSPDFSLVLESELATDLDLLIITFLLVGSSGLLRSF